MNLLPSIQKPQRSRNFISPMSGIMYDNTRFNQQPEEELEPTAHVIPRKKALRDSSGDKGLSGRLYEPKVREKSESSSRAHASKLYPFSTVETCQSGSNFLSSLIAPSPNEFEFPEVEVRYIDGIRRTSDLVKNTMKISLAFYFKNYFRKQLKGSVTSELIHLLE